MNCRGTMAPKNNSERLLTAAKSGKNEELRNRLIAIGKNRTLRNNEDLQEEEWKRSYTSKFLPSEKLYRTTATKITSTATQEGAPPRHKISSSKGDTLSDSGYRRISYFK
jgi:hypothetical protein